MQEQVSTHEMVWTIANAKQLLKFAPLSQLNNLCMSSFYAKQNPGVIDQVQENYLDDYVSDGVDGGGVDDEDDDTDNVFFMTLALTTAMPHKWESGVGMMTMLAKGINDDDDDDDDDGNDYVAEEEDDGGDDGSDDDYDDVVMAMLMMMVNEGV